MVVVLGIGLSITAFISASLFSEVRMLGLDTTFRLPSEASISKVAMNRSGLVTKRDSPPSDVADVLKGMVAGVATGEPSWAALAIGSPPDLTFDPRKAYSRPNSNLPLRVTSEIRVSMMTCLGLRSSFLMTARTSG